MSARKPGKPKKPDHWMQSAVPPKNKGKFTAKAKAAGKTVPQYAREKAHAGGTLGHEAQFALRAEKIAAKKKRAKGK